MPLPGKDVGAEDASDNVAEVRNVIDVGERGGHQDVAGAVFRACGPLEPARMFHSKFMVCKFLSRKKLREHF